MRLPAPSRLSVLALCVSLAACGDDESSVFPGFDTGRPDVTISDGTGTSASDATSQTTAGTDATTADTAPADTRPDETQLPLGALKQDPTYLVPGNISQKTEIAASGSLVAWVETPADGGHFFVVWDLAAAADGVRTYFVPNLVAPRQLALSRELLVYVDERYGDPDVFAVDLATGAASTIVALRGAQVEPALVGRRVVWADCRACVTGDDGAGWEIYTRVAGDPEARLTDDTTPDRRPTFGTLAPGEVVLAWIRARAELRVVASAVLDGGSGRDTTFDVASELRASAAVGWLAVTPGALAFRTRPLIVNPDSMIVNPDSMYPSDVMVAAVEGDALGATTRLTRHGELREGVDGALRAAGTRLAWIGSTPTTERVAVTDGLVEVAAPSAVDITTFALGDTFVGFVAPRADNGDLDDVWVLTLPD